ncbi:Crp/Fnr family transcriptional regulator [Bradyrhizobium sp.]|uniref:Crp/Fnr family transcriptional regulator n=1 Tax=Bradyrhizobium sp. TaxID=376 RepID=UPI003C792B92
MAKHSETTFASTCVTCPHRETGFCGTLLESSSGDSKAGRQPGWQHFVTARADEQIVVRNQAYDDVFVLCTGWAFRYFQLSDGRRQILKFLLPGDLFSPIAIFEGTFHFSVKALTDAQVSGFARSEIGAKCLANPNVQSAIANSCIADNRDATELLTALGQLSAEQRIAYLLLHLMQRVATRNVIREQRYPFPLRQQHIADAVGLTSVHVSRVFSLFRDRRILTLSEGVLQVSNPPELERIGSLR